MKTHASVAHTTGAKSLPRPARPSAALARVIQAARPQAKLRIGATTDPAEAEADRIAERVVQMPVAPNTASAADTLGARSLRFPPANAAPLRRLCAPCATELRQTAGEQPVRRLCAACEEELHKTPDSGTAATATYIAPTTAESAVGALGNGRPLNAAERNYFEPCFGRSFDSVRVHDGAAADRAARAVGARAFALGPDIAVASGEYSPTTTAGRRLMAHELAHTLQQDTAMPCLQREESRTFSDLDLELEVDLPARPPQLRPGDLRETVIIPAPPPGPAEFRLTPPTLGPTTAESRFRPSLDVDLSLPAPPSLPRLIRIPRRLPNRPLTWDDFTGTASGTGAAHTATLIDFFDVQGSIMAQARLNSSSSWVQDRHKYPGSNAHNGCPAKIADCVATLAGGSPYWTCCTPPTPDPCPAMIHANSGQITTAADCSSVFGPRCVEAARQESRRVLRHEQGHFSMAAVFADKANEALAAGRPQADVHARVNTQFTAAESAYDTDTRHGCDTTQQAAWEARIAAGLTAYSLY